MPSENNDLNQCEMISFNHKTSCSDIYNCCNCGGNDCGCRYCFSCNACSRCLDEDDEEYTKESISQELRSELTLSELTFSRQDEEEIMDSFQDAMANIGKK